MDNLNFRFNDIFIIQINEESDSYSHDQNIISFVKHILFCKGNQYFARDCMKMHIIMKNTNLQHFVICNYKIFSRVNSFLSAGPSEMRSSEAKAEATDDLHESESPQSVKK